MNLPRVYPIIDGELLARRGLSIVAAAEALLQAGARIIQLRWKEHFTREVFSEAEKVAGLCRSATAQFLVNDRADIAVLLDAGLHLGQDDLPPPQARRIVGPGRPIGFSTHNEDQFLAGDREPVDYLAIGPIFTTSNKADPDPVVGTAGLAGLRAATRKPVVAIGGITRANARQVWSAGADSVAVIGDMYPDNCTATSVKERFEEWIRVAANE
jgi:thiamine-phosphate pyrophosphorylase